MDQPTAIVACSDLMTASRLQDERVRTVPMRRADQLDSLLAAWPGAVWLVDLQSFASLPQRLAAHAEQVGAVVAFAPHVRTDLIEAAHEHCGRVLPRGAVVKRYGQVVLEALGQAG